MATLKVNTVSGIGTEGPVLDGGLKFRSENYMTLPKGDTTQRGRGRAVIFGGYQSSPGATTNEIVYFDIATGGNSIRFGDLGISQGYSGGAAASSTATRSLAILIKSCLVQTGSRSMYQMLVTLGKVQRPSPDS